MNAFIDSTEMLLAHLICADASGDDNTDYGGRRIASSGEVFAEFDAGTALHLDPLTPTKSYTSEHFGGSESESDYRIYTADAELLLNSVQDLIGTRAEIALVCSDRVKWTAYKKIQKVPKRVWVSAPGASLYEMHYREIFPNGTSTYYKRIAAVNKHGRPVKCLITGSNGNSGNPEGHQLVMAASLIEDAHRPGVLTSIIKDSTSIVLPVPMGEHKELFALRDAPLTIGGRRKAILHWVSRHLRAARSANREPTQIAAHLRGIREFCIDGLTVTLTPNTEIGATA